MCNWPFPYTKFNEYILQIRGRVTLKQSSYWTLEKGWAVVEVRPPEASWVTLGVVLTNFTIQRETGGSGTGKALPSVLTSSLP